MNATVEEWIWLVAGWITLIAGLWAFICWFIAPAVQRLQGLREEMEETDDIRTDDSSVRSAK
jgi:hypothetical protein